MSDTVNFVCMFKNVGEKKFLELLIIAALDCTIISECYLHVSNTIKWYYHIYMSQMLCQIYVQTTCLLSIHIHAKCIRF